MLNLLWFWSEMLNWILGSEKYLHDEGGLHIYNVQPEDIGMYECHAEIDSEGILEMRLLHLDVLCKYEHTGFETFKRNDSGKNTKTMEHGILILSCTMADVVK